MMATIAVPRAQIAEQPMLGANHAVPWELLGVPAVLAFGRATYPCEVERFTAGGAILRCADPVQPWTVATLRIHQFGNFHPRLLCHPPHNAWLHFPPPAH